MTQGTHPLAASMINQLNRVDMISNNLANANTVGFKEDSVSEGSFNSYLERTNKEGKSVSNLSYIMNTVPKIDNNYINSALGSISSTGNNLDFALTQADTYFKVESKNGEVELTRNGQFKILNGNLVTHNGYKVLDNTNNPILAADEELSARVAVVSANFKDLEKSGNNNYKFAEKDITIVENNQEYILQGSIERSNTNSINSMVSLIDAQRRFEQAQKAITGIDDINKKVIESIGNGR
ncbi:MAG: flagellar hook-basal body protein [Campylobacterota bacterium]|nr:flagellar hook-basal body protein [Campylobacterota bacterium]